MSNVISFLETLGRDANTTRMNVTEYAARVEALELDQDARQALLNRDIVALNDQLGGRKLVMCVLFPAEGEPRPDGEPGEPARQDEPDPAKAPPSN